jgi:hypothetical protein
MNSETSNKNKFADVTVQLKNVKFFINQTKTTTGFYPTDQT